MASILWNQGEEAFIDTVLNGAAVSPAIPAVGTGAGQQWGLGMGAQSGGVGGSGNKSVNNGVTTATIGEIGQTTAGGYSRKPISRATSGWPASTLSSGSHQSQIAAPITFTFTGTPNFGNSANSPATLWFVAKSITLAAVDCMFGSDLQGTNRSFNTGDTEQITVAYKQT